MFGIIKTIFFIIKFTLLCIIVTCMELYVNIPDVSKLIFGLLIASILINKQINWIAKFQIDRIKSVI